MTVNKIQNKTTDKIIRSEKQFTYIQVNLTKVVNV